MFCSQGQEGVPSPPVSVSVSPPSPPGLPASLGGGNALSYPLAPTPPPPAAPAMPEEASSGQREDARASSDDEARNLLGAAINKARNLSGEAASSPSSAWSEVPGDLGPSGHPTRDGREVGDLGTSGHPTRDGREDDATPPAPTSEGVSIDGQSDGQPPSSEGVTRVRVVPAPAESSTGSTAPMPSQWLQRAPSPQTPAAAAPSPTVEGGAPEPLPDSRPESVSRHPLPSDVARAASSSSPSSSAASGEESAAPQPERFDALQSPARAAPPEGAEDERASSGVGAGHEPHNLEHASSRGGREPRLAATEENPPPQNVAPGAPDAPVEPHDTHSPTQARSCPPCEDRVLDGLTSGKRAPRVST